MANDAIAHAGMSGDLQIVRNNIPVETMPDHVKEWLKSVGYDAETLARDAFSTRLHAHHFRLHPKGKFVAGEHFGTSDHPFAGEPHQLVEKRDLGPGLVTQSGAMYLANAVNFMTAATPFGSIADFNYHMIGTGSTAAAAADYHLGTETIGNSLTSPSAGTTATGYMTGTQTAPAAASPTTFKTVATFTAGTSINVTEWGLAMSSAARFLATETGTPSATDFPDSGASFTNTGNKLAGWTIEIASTAINTPTTTVLGQVAVNAANSATNLHLTAAGWLTLPGAIASTPPSTSPYVVYPTMLDRKVHAVISLVATDSLAYTYTNAISTGT